MPAIDDAKITNLVDFESLEREARNPFEGQVLRILKTQAAQLQTAIDASQRTLNEVVGLRGDISELRSEIRNFDETSKDTRRVALRAESTADIALETVERKVSRMRNAFDTLPDAVEVKRIAREAGEAAAEHAAFEATETATGRFRAMVEKERERPIPSDPVKAIVDRRIVERERDALVARVQWWQSAMLKWVLGGAAGGWAILRALEAFLTAHH